jgi:hypothetical protein
MMTRYVYACMCVCVCVCIYVVCVYVCMYNSSAHGDILLCLTSIKMTRYVYACMCVCVCIYVVCVYVCMYNSSAHGDILLCLTTTKMTPYVYACMYMYIYIYIYIYAHTYTYIYTYIHTGIGGMAQNTKNECASAFEGETPSKSMRFRVPQNSWFNKCIRTQTHDLIRVYGRDLVHVMHDLKSCKSWFSAWFTWFEVMI